VMDAWSPRIFASFAASAASVERPPAPAAVPEALDALELLRPEELEPELEPDLEPEVDPVAVDPDPAGLLVIALCCWASCFCAVVSAEA